MNQLSWLLYFSNLAGNIGPVLVMGAGACVIAGVAHLVAGSIMRSDAGCSWNADKDYDGRGKALQIKSAKFILPAIALSLLAAAVPSRNTIMAIAASEVGETILASSEVQTIGGEAGALASDSLKLLRKYVNEQLGDDAK